MGDTGVCVQMDCIMLKLEHTVASVMVQNCDSMHPHDTHTQKCLTMSHIQQPFVFTVYNEKQRGGLMHWIKKLIYVEAIKTTVKIGSC